MSDAAPNPGQAPNSTEQANTPDPWAAFPPEFNWVRKELEDARKEAAEKRVLARDLQEKLANAKTPEEVQQIVAANDTKTANLEAQLARERVARKTQLDEDLVEFLTGKTEEELMAQAAKLAGRKKADDDGTVVVTQQSPRGGLDPSTAPTETTGYDEWEKYKKNRH
jgi:hypothetical protein